MKDLSVTVIPVPWTFMSKELPRVHPVSPDSCSARNTASIVHYGQTTDMNVHPTANVLCRLLLSVPTGSCGHPRIRTCHLDFVNFLCGNRLVGTDD